MKGVIAMLLIVFGTVALGPWLNKSAEIATNGGSLPSVIHWVSTADRLYPRLSDFLNEGVVI